MSYTDPWNLVLPIFSDSSKELKIVQISSVTFLFFKNILEIGIFILLEVME